MGQFSTIHPAFESNRTDCGKDNIRGSMMHITFQWDNLMVLPITFISMAC